MTGASTRPGQPRPRHAARVEIALLVRRPEFDGRIDARQAYVALVNDADDLHDGDEVDAAADGQETSLQGAMPRQAVMWARGIMRLAPPRR